MNLFYVEKEPVAAAQALCDKHVVKMILETAQMLSTTHRLSETPQAPFVYKMTHKNHPSTKWLRSSQVAYRWGLEHLEALFAEYSHRYGKIHKTEREKFQHLKIIPQDLPQAPFVDPPQCMYDECRGADTVAAYRAYYRTRRNEIDMRWSKRAVPVWLD
jgi:hypothetical protein